MKYIIKGKYQGRTEDIDEVYTHQEALYLLKEYRLAFGSSWSMWFEEVLCDE